MKIHEYQAKELFRRYSIPTDQGVLVENKVDSLDLPFELTYVIKAQVHSGGRGKAGGVKVAKTKEEALTIINNMLGERSRRTRDEAVLHEEHRHDGAAD